MAFQRKIPSTPRELLAFLNQIHQNRAHVVSVKVDLGRCLIEVDLDGQANFFGYPDMFIPIQKGSIEAAKALVERLMRDSRKGFAPDEDDARELFDMIDPQAR